MKKLLYGCLFAFLAFDASAQTSETPPGVVELFTSEGCATCPPAELTMGRLQKEYPGLIVLSYHVDNGDNGDWKDPNSKPEWVTRQQEYATKAFRDQKRFTPQAITNGRGSTMGHNQKGLEAMLETQASRATPKPPIRLSLSSKAENLMVSYETTLEPGQALLISLIRKKVTSAITGGPNRGKSYPSTNVVLEQKTVRGIKGIVQFSLPANSAAGDYSIVAFVQDMGTLQISNAVETLL